MTQQLKEEARIASLITKLGDDGNIYIDNEKIDSIIDKAYEQGRDDENSWSEKKVDKFRENKLEQLGLSGCCVWNNIDEIPLTESQKACVLEWVAQKLQSTKYAEENDIWTYGKSYDPLSINVKEKVAHSYVIDFDDGGRHHPFVNMKYIEDGIFNEFFNSKQQ